MPPAPPLEMPPLEMPALEMPPFDEPALDTPPLETPPCVTPPLPAVPGLTPPAPEVALPPSPAPLLPPALLPDADVLPASEGSAVPVLPPHATSVVTTTNNAKDLLMASTRKHSAYHPRSCFNLA